MKGVRVLITREHSHRSYGDALQGTIRGLRPVAEVSLVRVSRSPVMKWPVSSPTWWCPADPAT
jgi:hypothetical protein